MFENGRMFRFFSYVQLSRIWCEKRPSNQGDLDLTVTGKVQTIYYTTF